MRFHVICLLTIGFIGCQPKRDTDINGPASANSSTNKLATAAIKLTKGPYVTYDPAYKSIPYPKGDVAHNRGVCADVVVRAFRAAGHDLQALLHQDMQANFHLYPKKWGLRAPDSNIDHRRVPNLMTWFQRMGKSISGEKNIAYYQPGDIVAWELSDGRPHIGIVVDGYGANGWPLVVHNIGNGQTIANVLFSWKVAGHYRWGKL